MPGIAVPRLLDRMVSAVKKCVRTKDQMHLRDMIEVGLIDSTWTKRYPPELSARLQQILDNPEN